MKDQLLEQELYLSSDQDEDLQQKQTGWGTLLSKGQISSEVLDALRHGEHNAYDEIYLHYYKPLYDFVHTLVRSHEDAEDIIHNVFINVWENRKNIEPEQGIHRYLFVVARNLAMRHFRRKKSENNYMQYKWLQSPVEHAADEAFAVKEVDALVEVAISRMPRVRRQIFRMFYQDNLSYEQIADRLGMNKATVANHLSHAKKDIRSML